MNDDPRIAELEQRIDALEKAREVDKALAKNESRVAAALGGILAALLNHLIR